MAQSVRERTSELAVLKTLGFPNATIVLARARRDRCFMAVIGGGLGLGIMWLLVSQGGFNNALPAGVHPAGRDVAIGALLCVGARRCSPARCRRSAAMRLRITDALRRN